MKNNYWIKDYHNFHHWCEESPSFKQFLGKYKGRKLRFQKRAYKRILQEMLKRTRRETDDHRVYSASMERKFKRDSNLERINRYYEKLRNYGS